MNVECFFLCSRSFSLSAKFKWAYSASFMPLSQGHEGCYGFSLYNIHLLLLLFIFRLCNGNRDKSKNWTVRTRLRTMNILFRNAFWVRCESTGQEEQKKTHENIENRNSISTLRLSFAWYSRATPDIGDEADKKYSFNRFSN